MFWDGKTRDIFGPPFCDVGGHKNEPNLCAKFSYYSIKQY